MQRRFTGQRKQREQNLIRMRRMLNQFGVKWRWDAIGNKKYIKDIIKALRNYMFELWNVAQESSRNVLRKIALRKGRTTTAKDAYADIIKENDIKGINNKKKKFFISIIY